MMFSSLERAFGIVVNNVCSHRDVQRGAQSKDESVAGCHVIVGKKP